MSTANIRTRAICFTLNNPTDDERHDLFNALESLAYGIKFTGCGREIGEEGTPHLQGFICFGNAKTFSAIHSIPGLLRAHFEVMKGSVDSNITYCSKEGEYVEFGVKPAQGKRTDLDEVVALIKDGKRIRDVVDSCPTQFIKFNKGIEKLIALQVQPRNAKTKVLWYWGPTGTGKSKLAFEKAYEASSYYVKDPLNRWWDGYEQQEVVIIDDYRRDFSTFAALLRLLDRYPMSVEMKGATTQFNSSLIIITSPKSPSETWETRTEEELGQLLRRVDEVHHFANPLNIPF